MFPQEKPNKLRTDLNEGRIQIAAQPPYLESDFHYRKVIVKLIGTVQLLNMA